MWKTKVRRLLSEKLKGTQALSRDSSMRDFAARIGLSSGTLSELLSGKRKLTVKMAKRIVELLALTDEERQLLLSELESPHLRGRKILRSDDFDFISNWIYFGILSALELDAPPRTVAQIAKFLGTSEEKTRQSLEDLVSHGYIEFKDEKYFGLHKTLSTTDEEPSEVIRNRHCRNMEVSVAAIRQLPVDERDFTSLTFSANKSQLPLAKKMIRKFLEKLSSDMSEGVLDQVVQVNVQLFPLNGWDKNHE